MSEKKIVLKSSDGESFEVDEAVALKSKLIADVIEETSAGDAVLIQEVKGNILKLVIEYCKKHVESDDSLTDETKADLMKWDSDFMEMEQSTLFDVIMAANYLNIEDLLDLSCQTVTDMIKGKTAEEIRAHFNIKNDLTEEEQKEEIP